MAGMPMLTADSTDSAMDGIDVTSSSVGGAGNSMGTYGAAAQLGGNILSGIGGMYAGEMESAALSAQANLQRQNALLDLEAGHINAQRSIILSGQRIGGLQSAAAASGVNQSGSVLSLMASSIMNSEMDRQNILHGSQVKAIQAENQAALDEVGAKSAQVGGTMAAIGGVLSTGLMIAALA